MGNIDIFIELGLSLITIDANQLQQQHKSIIGNLFSGLHEYNIDLFSHGEIGYNICMLVSGEEVNLVMLCIYQQFLTQK